MEESARPRICDPCATFKRRPDDCGRTSATSRPSTMPSPPSTGPSDARGRRSSAFVLQMQGLHLAQLLSVNVGQPREITWRGKTVYTSVWKEPVQLRTNRR